MVGEDTHPTAMWCRQCQQDVPVMRSGAGAAACPRCRATLGQPGDAGVPLESFDRAPVAALAMTPPSVRRWRQDDAAVELRRIGRRLRPAPSHAAEVTYHATPAAELPRTTPRPLMETAAKARPKKPVRREPRPARISGASLVADVGLVVMIAGAATLAGQSQGVLAPEVWPWGVGEAAVGLALFAVGVFRLATQTSQECRRLEREVDALRAEVEELRDASSAANETVARGAPGLKNRGLMDEPAVKSRVL